MSGEELPLSSVIDALRGPGELTVGTWVRCEREAPPRGTWSRYQGRVGRVAVLNGGEVGVSWSGRAGADAWFLATELCPVEAGGAR